MAETSSSLLKRIQMDYKKSAESEFSGESLAGIITLIKQQFSRSLIFIQEFMQNAEDANSSEITFDFYEDKIIIKNNGYIFNNENVKTICKIGRSDKLFDNDKIGQFGIGFKSIFLIGRHVEVHSGDFHFKFSRDDFDENSVFHDGIWMLFPLELTCSKDCEYTKRERGSTFVVHTNFNPKEILEKFGIDYSKYVNERTLLFLNNLHKFEFRSFIQDYEFNCVSKKDDNNNAIKCIDFSKPTRSKNITFTPYYYHTFDFLEIIENQEIESEELNLFNSQYVKKRSDGKIPIKLAFQLKSIDKHYELIPTNGNIQLPLYSYLPFKEFNNYYLPFHLCSDFVITPNREKILEDHSMNKNIIDILIKVLKSKLFPFFMYHEFYRFNWFKSMYFNSYTLLEPLSKFLHSTLEKEKIFPIYGKSNELGSEGEIISIDQFYDYEKNCFKYSLSIDDFYLMFPEKKILDIRVRKSTLDEDLVKNRVRKYLLQRPERVHDIILKETSNVKAKNHTEYYESKKIREKIEWLIHTKEEWNLIVIPDKETDANEFFELTDKNNITTIHNSLRNPQILGIIQDHFKFPKRKLKDFSSDTELIDELRNKWKDLDETEKIKGTIDLLRNLKEDNSKISNPISIRVEDIDGKNLWVTKNGNIIFHSDFNEDIKNKSVQKVFLRYMHELKSEFIYILSPEYYKQGNYSDVTLLKKYLGVNSIFEKNKRILTGYFAEYLVYEYLKKQVSKGHVEQILEKFCNVAYDFRIKENGIKKIIEVKSNAANYDSVNATWTPTETAELMRWRESEHPETYEIYWVINVYEDPVIHIFNLKDYIELDAFKKEISTKLYELKKNDEWRKVNFSNNKWE